MVHIRRGKEQIKVSGKTYEHIYKPMGYRIVKNHGEDKAVKNGKGEGGQFDVPISEMTKEQLREFADAHGIDTSGARNLKEAQRIVRDALRESKM